MIPIKSVDNVMAEPVFWSVYKVGGMYGISLIYSVHSFFPPLFVQYWRGGFFTLYCTGTHYPRPSLYGEAGLST